MKPWLMKHLLTLLKKKKYFEGCMPTSKSWLNVSIKTLYGPMKPVGLNIRITRGLVVETIKTPYAVVQLRQGNALEVFITSLFQTHLKWETKRVFKFQVLKMLICRYGAMHRNSYMDS